MKQSYMMLKKYSILTITICLFLSLMISIVSFAYDAEKNLDAGLDEFNICNVSDAEKFIEKYFQETNIQIEIVSTEYIEYLTSTKTTLVSSLLKRISRQDLLHSSIGVV